MIIFVLGGNFRVFVYFIDPWYFYLISFSSFLLFILFYSWIKLFFFLFPEFFFSVLFLIVLPILKLPKELVIDCMELPIECIAQRICPWVYGGTFISMAAIFHRSIKCPFAFRLRFLMEKMFQSILFLFFFLVAWISKKFSSIFWEWGLRKNNLGVGGGLSMVREK